jgi:tRNA (guanine37-N1)-methyltransferase
MKIDIITLFPDMFKGPFDESIIKRAQNKGIVEIKIHNLRNWTEDRHNTVDDRPYGGGTGMVLMVEPFYKALSGLRTKNSRVILMTPQGNPYKQSVAKRLSGLSHIILIAGHYEGYDERIRENLIDEEISMGDFVLTGGEIPVMAIVDSIVRLIPGVLEKDDATVKESFSENLLEYPQYTRPEEFNKWKVPEILLSGDHAKIEKWRKEKSVEKTKARRPDLISPTPEE